MERSVIPALFVLLFTSSVSFSFTTSKKLTLEDEKTNSTVLIDSVRKNKKKKSKKEKNKIDTSIPPSKFFDLSDWSLSVPTDTDGNGRSDHIYENELNNGYSSEYFYATEDGGMVLRSAVEGYRTSDNTEYTRSELREMLRAGDEKIKTKGPTKNNWVFQTSPDVSRAGGYDGILKATLAVNHVTRTGEKKQVGRVIIGQIHAAHDEPLRLYYRKLPNNSKGSIYFVHVTKNKEDQTFYELIGSRADDALNPVNGIALDEKFSYEVVVAGTVLSVKIIRPGKPIIHKIVSMTTSGYDVAGEYMYFKAGVYNQNRTAKPTDYVQATFYNLENGHSKYVKNQNVVLSK